MLPRHVITVRRVLGDEEGQGLAEYAFILLLIVVVAVAALTVLGPEISSMLSDIGNAL